MFCSKDTSPVERSDPALYQVQCEIKIGMTSHFVLTLFPESPPHTHTHTHRFLTWSFSGLSEKSLRLLEVRFLWVVVGLPTQERSEHGQGFGSGGRSLESLIKMK